MAVAVASAELLPVYDCLETEKLPYYCHWDRCVMFRVDEGYVGHIPQGVIALPFELREEDEHH